jgi:hypothetical protein
VEYHYITCKPHKPTGENTTRAHAPAAVGAGPPPASAGSAAASRRRRLRECAVAPGSPFVMWPAAVDSPAYLHAAFWSVDENHGIAKAAPLRLPTLEYRPLPVDLRCKSGDRRRRCSHLSHDERGDVSTTRKIRNRQSIVVSCIGCHKVRGCAPHESVHTRAACCRRAVTRHPLPPLIQSENQKDGAPSVEALSIYDACNTLDERRQLSTHKPLCRTSLSRLLGLS